MIAWNGRIFQPNAQRTGERDRVEKIFVKKLLISEKGVDVPKIV